MALRAYPTRLLFASALCSLLILTLCGVLAASLIREQARTADQLGEDIDSKREAADLEETLSNLIALHQRGVIGVEPLHGRVEAHLREIHRFANTEEEKDYSRDLSNSFRFYLLLWSGRLPRTKETPSPAQYLQDNTLIACRQLRSFNSARIDASEREHRLSLQRMTWGLAIIGGLGSVGGLVLGYGLARSLRRTIHQFLVQVQGAADRLGQELPAVEWRRDGGPLTDGADELIQRVEQVVLELQQREREVRRAEQLAAVGQLAAGVAHEIRNPLTSAILLIQTSRRDPSAGGLTEEDLDLIEGELQRIEGTLRLFLDFARPPKPERATCDLNAIVKDALALARVRIEQQQVSVHLDGLQVGWLVDADREQLRQVIVNLILNGLDVMPHGGTLGLAVRTWGEDQLELIVTDTGPGIAEDILPRLFQPFATSKETGLGLGLVVSRRIIEDHGGVLEGMNRPGGGACFIMRLPYGSLRSTRTTSGESSETSDANLVADRR